MILTAASTSTTAATMQSETTLTVVVPKPGYQLIVWGVVEMVSTSSTLALGTAYVQENTDVEGVGSYSAADTEDLVYDPSTSGQSNRAHLLFARNTLTPGNVYGYRLFADSFSGGGSLGGTTAGGHRIVVDLRPPT